MKKFYAILMAAVVSIGAITATAQALPGKKAPNKAKTENMLKNVIEKTPVVKTFKAAPMMNTIEPKAGTAVANKPFQVTPLITEAPEGTLKFYNRSGMAYYRSSGSIASDEQEGILNVVYADNNEVYLYNPICYCSTESWVKGTIEGNTITVELPQTLYLTSYGYNLELAWVNIVEGSTSDTADRETTTATFTIDGNTITGTGWNSVFAAGVCASAGVVENCLIKGNSARCYNDNGGIEASALNLSGTAQAANCTIIDNIATMNGSGRKPMTTYAAKNAKIVNCAIFGNTCVVADYTVWAGTAANYVNCVSDSSAAINATCSTAVDPGFADPANGNYTPTYASPLRDAGSNADYAVAALSETDLKGDARILNETIDVGACEYVPSTVMAADFTYTVNQRLLPASVTFSAVVENAPGVVTYRWDFDNDGTVDLVTQEAEITNEYSVAGIYDVTLTTVSGQETATAFRQNVVRAIQRDVYVATDGSNAYPYATPETAASTVHTAVDAAADGCIVHVLPGTYVQSAPFTLDKAVTITSTTTNAADVILRNTLSGERVATVSHERAELAGVTLTGGSASKLGGALTLTAGLVRDCTLTGNGVGGCRDSDGRSGMVCMSGGRLMRCRLVANDGGISWNADCAGGVNASGGVVDTCLVATNRMSYWGGQYTAALGVKLTGDARAVNCTIVGNVCKNPGRQSNGNGAYPMATHASSNARFINCLIWGNVTEGGDEQNYVWHGTDASYVNCHSELTINATSPAVTNPGFVDASSGDYAIRKDSPLVNKGADYTEAGGISAFDLTGKQPRLIGKRVDIGCFEANASHTILFVR